MYTDKLLKLDFYRYYMLAKSHMQLINVYIICKLYS